MSSAGDERPLLVGVTGDGSGLGKSTLARMLGDALSADFVVELFREADILVDACFAGVMTEFRETGEVALGTLLDAAGQYAGRVCERRPDVVVLDSLFPYLPSLFAWGYSDEEIRGFFSALDQSLRDVTFIQLHLSGDCRTALDRAAAREGGDWLDRQVAKTGAFRDPTGVSTAEDLAAYLERSAARASRLLAEAPWHVEVIAGFDGTTDPLPVALAALAAATDIRSR